MDFFLCCALLAVVGFACHVIEKDRLEKQELQAYLNIALDLLHEHGVSSIELAEVVEARKVAKR